MTTATATVTRWGNGAGVLVPKAVRDDLGLRVGDRVCFTVEEGRAVLEPAGEGWTLHDLMRGYEGPKPAFIDPGASAGREAW